MKKPLQIMKFGGTSVGDARCMAKVVDIVCAASREFRLVVVVSAMSGVTDRLVQAATEAEAGNVTAVAGILTQLRQQHETTLKSLIQNPQEQRRIAQKIDQLFAECDRLCQGTILLGELTLRARDAISSIGERLSVPLIAAALKERGVENEPIEATSLMVTNSSHGAAEPLLDLTRERCQRTLLPRLKAGIVPIITGFIGATADGVLTTLGRGGSDYSASVIGAVLDADEVLIWTDVDGLMTADPRLVPDACTIPEISYREASELAFFGAKVLHPKTLRPLLQRGIPLSIRNTFAPEKPGSRITLAGAGNLGVTAITMVSDAALISICGSAMATVPDVLRRTVDITRELRADVLLISQSSSQNEICLAVPTNMSKPLLQHLYREFAEDIANGNVEDNILHSTVAVLIVVGENMKGISRVLGRTFGALGRENVDTIATSYGASHCNLSLVVRQQDARKALLAAHREFHLGTPTSELDLEEPVAHSSLSLNYQPAAPCAVLD